MVNRTPKKHFLTSFDVFFVKNSFRCVRCRRTQKTNVYKLVTSKAQQNLVFLGMETPKSIATKFCMLRTVRDAITHANFDDDRLRGFDVARGRIFAFSSDLLR